MDVPPSHGGLPAKTRGRDDGDAKQALETQMDETEVAMKVLLPLGLVLGVFLLGLVAAPIASGWFAGVVVPWLAAAVFLFGLVYRVAGWARSPVPFRIPTTGGQQRSLSWIRPSRLDNPHTKTGVLGRMALEVLVFRSLLRNTRTRMVEGRGLVYGTSLTLWAAALIMHWALAFILVRHLRLFVEPVPAFVNGVAGLDGFLAIGLPTVYVTTLLFLLALGYLMYRRLAHAQVRYISLPSDYLALFLLIGIGLSGFWMRHLARTDVSAIKELALGLARFAPVVPDGISPLFFGHLFLVSALLVYFPFSKLVHAPGVFLSPTRNMANTNREVRHVNPWDYPVHVHTYDEYEDELREKMVGAGIPVEKESS